MAINYTPNLVASGHISRETLNANLEAIQTALQDGVSRSGDSPNNMSVDLDMDGNRILNLPDAVDPTEPVTLGQLLDILNGEE